MIYRYGRKELKNLKASGFKHGDAIFTGKYIISIKYSNNGHIYNTPYWCSRVENRFTGRILDCTPGCGWPYYIDDFLRR